MYERYTRRAWAAAFLSLLPAIAALALFFRDQESHFRVADVCVTTKRYWRIHSADYWKDSEHPNSYIACGSKGSRFRQSDRFFLYLERVYEEQMVLCPEADH